MAETNDIASIEGALLRLKTARLCEYNQPVYIAPVAKPNLQAPDNSALPLMDKVREFLAGNGQVMLIMGDSGAGKSTFNRHLENKLWTNYETGGRIPLFISLPALKQPDEDLVAKQLRAIDFSKEQIWDLKQHRQFLLICDGYDESQLTTNLHTSNFFNRPGQWDVKLIITCRTQYLGPDYRDRFAPEATCHYHRTAYNLFQEAVIAPFSKEQVELYVEKFVPLIPQTWAKEDYMDKLATIPNLMDLVRNPFLLTLALEALPSVIDGKSDLSNLKITRVGLYDTFVDHWLEVNRRRLHKLTFRDNKRLALENLLADEFMHNGIIFQKELAEAIFQEQDGRPIVKYSNRRDIMSWKARFFGVEPEISLLRDSSLLSRSGNQYRFIHRSVLEYFFSCFVWDTSRDGYQFVPHVYSEATGLSLPVTDHPLSKRSLVPEPSVIQFLVERVQMQPIFKQYLLALIELSKSDPLASMAASNAITILVRAGRHFNGADLRGICIPGANLTGGQFDSAQLQDSDLTGITFTKAWIRQADFSGARMEETRFGELPSLHEASKVHSCAFSPDGRSFATGLRNGNISIYDTTTWTMIRLLLYDKSVKSLAYSTTGHQLLSGGSGGTVRLWDGETVTTSRVLKRHTQEVTAVAFSPSGMQQASASSDRSVHLSDIQTETITFAIPHFRCVTGIAYSPDGSNIASCCLDGQVRVFDTQTGLLVLSSGKSDASDLCLAYSPNGQLIVSGGYTGSLQLWDATTMILRTKWGGHSVAVRSVEFSPNGQWIVSGGDDRMVKVWSRDAATLVSIFAGHTGGITCVAFSPDGSLIASGSEDHTIRLWEVTTMMPRTKWTGHPETVTTPKGQSIVSGSNDKTVKVWGGDAATLVSVFTGHTDSITSVTFSPDGSLITSGSKDRTARLWEVNSGGFGLDIDGAFDSKPSVAYSPDGRFLTSGSRAGAIEQHDAESGEVGLVIRLQEFRAKSIAYSSDGRQIAMGGSGGDITLWSAHTNNILENTLRGHTKDVNAVAFSPCGQWIASGGDDRTVRLWDARSGTSIQVISGDDVSYVRSLSFSSSGTEIAFRDIFGMVQAWDVTTGKCRMQKGGSNYWFCFVRYLPRSLQIVCCDGYNGADLWDEEGRHSRVILQHGRITIQHFAFSSCGQWIASVEENTIHLWRSSLEERRQDWKYVLAVEGCLGNIEEIVWRPNKLEFATADVGGCTRVWRVVERFDKVVVQLVWGTGGGSLVASGSLLDDAIGLNTINRNLLEQRGAFSLRTNSDEFLSQYSLE